MTAHIKAYVKFAVRNAQHFKQANITSAYFNLQTRSLVYWNSLSWESRMVYVIFCVRVNGKARKESCLCGLRRIQAC